MILKTFCTGLELTLKAKPTKIQYIDLERNISDSYVLNIDGMKITSTDEVALLDVSIVNKLTFKNHNDELCRKESYKPHALCHIRLFYQKKKQVICKYFY